MGLLEQVLKAPFIKILVRVRLVIISMMVLYNDNVMIEYDKRRSQLPSASLDMEYDNNSTESTSPLKSSKHEHKHQHEPVDQSSILCNPF